MFDKYIEVTIKTRFEKEDHFKISDFAHACCEPKWDLITVHCDGKDVYVIFNTKKSMVKKIKEQLTVLNKIGIEGEIRVK